jgi:hypothetical protein
MIVGFTGVAGCGKDTAGNFYVNTLGWKKFAFANVLKESMKTLFMLSDEQVYGALKETVDERWGVTPRHILQWFGTDVMRNQFDVNFFIKHARFTLQTMLSDASTRGIVITDVRFDNEADLIHELGGRVIKIVRSVSVKSTHESEQGIAPDKLDIVGTNNGTIQELHKSLQVLLLLRN